jgi:phosphatidate phosphatase APP1
VIERRRLHVSARVEDALHRAVGSVLAQRGWSPRVTASTGYGGSEAIRVFARVLLAPAAAADAQAAARPRWKRRAAARPAHAPRGWRSLVALPAAGTEVRLTVGAEVHLLHAERGGYVHAEVPAVLSPGWHDATLEVGGRAPVSCRIRIVDANATHGVVSDIDDTVLVTWLPRPLLAAWNTFFLREHARRPVPGMSELLRTLAGEDGFMVYLSTGAWNFAPHLERFMVEHRFPPGPLFLTDWGPTQDGWFRSGAAHKRETLERLRREHPQTRWILVGDDGQRDPQIYAEFATAHPEAVSAVAIRRLSPTQQVLAAGAASPRRGDRVDQAAAEQVPVAWVTGADGHELSAALAAAGVGSGAQEAAPRPT